jgi:phenylpropionate dioxygenase-like ring-hydroxylating dioxygenase large terminal subunit
MGETPVIVCRGRNGTIHAFQNSCRHRGNRLCRVDQGNAKAFVCSYHGWAYDTAGRLIGVPGKEDYYRNEINQGEWGLPAVRIASYGGLIFGTFDAQAPTLDEYLGDMRWGLDMLLGQGDFVAVPGIARWVIDCNWKFASDNAIGDMYHGLTSHRSAMMAGHASGTGYSVFGAGDAQLDRSLFRRDNGFTLVTAYGHGLTASYTTGKSVDPSSPLARWRTIPAIVERLGPRRIRVQRANMNVFPNLFVNSGSRELILRNPLGRGKTEFWKTTLVDRNLSEEEQRMQVRASNRHFGPAGMFEQDDGENWSLSTAGCASAVEQRYALNYAMGMGHGSLTAGSEGEPPLIEALVNEHAQLWMYRCWGEYLTAETWPELQKNHLHPNGTL